MDKKYNHTLVENNKNQKWIDKRFFSEHDLSKPPYTIILPPPNVTGKLHLGHAWDGYIQDTLIRYKKLQGFDVKWVAAMDHAGIATQAKVEARLKENNQSRYQLGRKKFLEKVWEWKEEYALTIRKQWGKLGLSLDYSNERFTMDQGLSKAVTKVFIDLYKRKLIYRGDRAINWDPKLQTVLSNIEVDSKETKSIMYYFKYPLKKDSFIKIATTRPETMFSDVAIAINPNDEKMKKFIGQVAISPLTNQELPIIPSELIEIGKGTGAMKVSAHAEMDIDIIKKNNLEINECIDKEGKMNYLAQDLIGSDRFEARKEVVKKLKNFLIKEESIVNAIGYSQRSNAIVETLVQPQWFVKMKPMAKLILDDLQNNSVNFFPDRFKNNLKTWMNLETIQDWCISRQLWWGHRIPVWYKDEDIKVQEMSPGDEWVQDEDVLDTWFSSGLAPFSFLGWPNSIDALKRYYPTNVLVTGYDIIFFWVARMYFQSLDIMEEKPFKDVLIHGLIRAEDGKKMSKSLGNGIDPMDVINNHGSDSLRWFLLTNSTPGQDIRYSKEKIEAAWNINNKLWNISRYILEIMPDDKVSISQADHWIENKLSVLENLVSKKMEEYEFTIIGKALTKFIMDDFSSWYIEISKEVPNKNHATYILKRLLIILHPFLPFITDHVFSLINNEEILEQSWKILDAKGSTTEIDDAISIIKLFKDFRVSQMLKNNDEIKYFTDYKLSNLQLEMVFNLANAKINNHEEIVKSDHVFVPFSKNIFYIKISKQQIEREQEYTYKRIESLNFEIKRAEKMLNNQNFIKKAPQNKIDEEQKKLKKYKEELDSLQLYKEDKN